MKPILKTITRIQVKFADGRKTYSEKCYLEVKSIRKFRSEIRAKHPEASEILLAYEEVDDTPLA